MALRICHVTIRNKGFNRKEIDEKILCYKITHHAGAYFIERAARHDPELLEMTLPNGEKFVNTCPLCDKGTPVAVDQQGVTPWFEVRNSFYSTY